MVERGRAPGRAVTWPAADKARAGGATGGAQWWSRDWGAAQRRLQTWLVAERAPGRLVPWLPVAFGAGVALYFSAGREPALWAVTAALLLAAAGAFLCRRKALAFSALLLTSAACAGFACATAKTVFIDHPVLAFPVTSGEITGWIVRREERERTDRITVAVTRFEARRQGEPLQRIRVTVRKGTAPPLGSFVSFKARLNPPLSPLRPGGYDFARDLYFQDLGATGFVLGAVKQLEPPHALGYALRFKVAVGAIRDGIDSRIRSILTGDVGAIASALITGKRDAISAPVNEAMYVSSLAHVLSISGYHMALVAGAVFFFVRGLLALSPTLAMRYPIKKWAAAAALLAASGYLVLSGAEIATQRAFIMTAIVLTGVMLDRPALTLRTLAVAATGILLFAPESLVHPSFQMSFAATLALVAVYERGLPWMHGGADTPTGARIALWGGREIVALIIASLVAGLATTLYAAYHFHRLAPYGVLANLLAMPIVSAWVMPVGLLALFLLPFGLDAFLWQLMGLGIEWMIAVAVMVARLPGAVGRVTAFDVGAVLLGTSALIVVCLLRSPLRWTGVPIAVLAIWSAARTPLPDVLISHDAGAVAVRSASGHLSAHRIGSDSFSIRSWLAADADGRAAGDPTLAQGLACDDAGCTLRLRDGAIVAVALSPEAFEDDCRRAVLIVTRRQAPPGCAASVIDRDTWRSTGAIAAYWTGTGLALRPAYPPGTDRPWAKARPSVTSPSVAPGRPVISPPDATPMPDDLGADD